jgi:hypothetical protein
MVRKTVYPALYYMPVKIVKTANKRLLKVRPSAISDSKKMAEKDYKTIIRVPSFGVYYSKQVRVRFTFKLEMLFISIQYFILYRLIDLFF